MVVRLQKISVSRKNSCFVSVDGVLYDIDKTRLIQYPAGRDDKAFAIPNTVTEIWWDAFRGCTSLQSVVLPGSLKEIRNKAFENCTDLKEIHCRMESLKDVKIGSDLFDESIYGQCTLFIPPGTRWAYRHHEVFGKFKNIEIEFEE